MFSINPAAPSWGKTRSVQLQAANRHAIHYRYLPIIWAIRASSAKDFTIGYLKKERPQRLFPGCRKNMLCRPHRPNHRPVSRWQHARHSVKPS
jgi:hypothetical protein